MDSNTDRTYDVLSKLLAGFRDLHQLFQEIRTEESQDEKAERICRYFKTLSGAQETALFLLNPKTERLQFRHAVGKRAGQFVGGVLDIDRDEFQPLYESALQATHFQTLTIQTPQQVYDFHDKFVIVVPIMVLSTAYGILLCEYDHAVTIDDSDQVELIRVFLNQLSPLIECEIETQRLEEKSKHLDLLYEIGSHLSTIRDEDQLLETIMTLIEKYLQVDRCSLMIMDKDRKCLRIKKAFGMPNVDIRTVKVLLGEGIAGSVAMDKQPLLIQDIASEGNPASLVEKKELFRTNSLLSVPLIAQEEVIGVINVNNRKDGLPFSQTDMALLCKISSVIAAVLQRSYLSLQLKKARELESDIKHSMI